MEIIANLKTAAIIITIIEFSRYFIFAGITDQEQNVWG